MITASFFGFRKRAESGLKLHLIYGGMIICGDFLRR